MVLFLAVIGGIAVIGGSVIGLLLFIGSGMKPGDVP